MKRPHSLLITFAPCVLLSATTLGADEHRDLAIEANRSARERLEFARDRMTEARYEAERGDLDRMEGDLANLRMQIEEASALMARSRRHLERGVALGEIGEFTRAVLERMIARETADLAALEADLHEQQKELRGQLDQQESAMLDQINELIKGAIEGERASPRSAAEPAPLDEMGGRTDRSIIDGMIWDSWQRIEEMKDVIEDYLETPAGTEVPHLLRAYGTYVRHQELLRRSDRTLRGRNTASRADFDYLEAGIESFEATHRTIEEQMGRLIDALEAEDGDAAAAIRVRLSELNARTSFSALGDEPRAAVPMPPRDDPGPFVEPGPVAGDLMKRLLEQEFPMRHEQLLDRLSASDLARRAAPDREWVDGALDNGRLARYDPERGTLRMSSFLTNRDLRPSMRPRFHKTAAADLLSEMLRAYTDRVARAGGDPATGRVLRDTGDWLHSRGLDLEGPDLEQAVDAYAAELLLDLARFDAQLRDPHVLSEQDRFEEEFARHRDLVARSRQVIVLADGTARTLEGGAPAELLDRLIALAGLGQTQATSE